MKASLDRCCAVHDFDGFRILRCALANGHDGPHKPKGWERCSEAEYQALLEKGRAS